MKELLLLFFLKNSTIFTCEMKAAKHGEINLKQMYFHHSFMFGMLEGQYALFSSPQCRLIFGSLKLALSPSRYHTLFFLYV